MPQGRQYLNVTTSRDGWRAAGRELTVAPDGLRDLQVPLQRGALLTGRVLTADGRPAPAVYVAAEPDARVDLRLLRVETAADGSFRIAGLPDGDALVMAWDPTRGAAREQVGRFTAGGSMTVELRLQPACFISGRVTFDDGSPAAAVSVAFTGDGRALPYTSVSTADDGRFSVRGLLPGRYTVKARRKSGPWNLTMPDPAPDVRVVTLEPDEHAAGIDLVLARGGQRIEGRVLHADGRPAAGTQVIAAFEKLGRAAKPLAPDVESLAIVRDDGRFVLEDLERGDHSLFAVRPGFPDAVLRQVAAGRTDVRLQLEAPARLSGVVTDRDGRALPAFSLQVLPLAPTGAETEQQSLLRTEAGVMRPLPVRDPDGRFEWRGLLAGRYRIKVNGLDGAAGTDVVTVASGEHKQGLRLVVGGALKLTGKVVSLETGAPMERVQVYARAPGNPLVATTNDEGAFEMVGLLPGEDTEVTVRATGFVSESRWVRAPAGAATVDAGTFRLLRGDFAGTGPMVDGLRFVLADRGSGARVAVLFPGSNAERAGLKIGDHITGPESARPALSRINGAALTVIARFGRVSATCPVVRCLERGPCETPRLFPSRSGEVHQVPARGY